MSFTKKVTVPVCVSFGLLSLSMASVWAEPFRASQLSASHQGFKFTVQAEKAAAAECAYKCWEEVTYLSSEQLSCVRNQIKEVKDLLSEPKNAALLKISKLEEIRVKLTDNTQGFLPNEKKYAEYSGYLLKWIMMVHATLTSKHDCFVTPSVQLGALLAGKIKDQLQFEETLSDASEIVNLVSGAPNRISNVGRNPASAEAPQIEVTLPADYELRHPIQVDTNVAEARSDVEQAPSRRRAPASENINNSDRQSGSNSQSSASAGE